MNLGAFINRGLSPQREVFVQGVVSGLSQSDAYRAAYKVRPGTKPESINQQASALMADLNISSRVEELRKPVIEAAQITLAAHLRRLQELSESAESVKQFSAAINAEVSRGKASGLYVEKSEVKLTTVQQLADPDLDNLIAQKAREAGVSLH